MTIRFETATRQNSKVLIGLYAGSGCGKTYSGLLLARGLAGEQGEVAMIDTENGRGALYADEIPGGYSIAQLGEPFSPQRYIEAIDAAERAGASVLVIDSISHEWEGIGGVCDQAAEIEKKTGKSGLHCWKEPKQEHKKMLLKLLSTPMHVIVCLRAKHKTKQVKNPKTGKQEVVTDDHVKPIQDSEFIFEMTAHIEIYPDHNCNVTKAAPNSLQKCLPHGGKITMDTGRAIADWCAGSQQPAAAQEAQNAPEPAGLGDDEFRLLQEAVQMADSQDALTDTKDNKLMPAKPRMTQFQYDTLINQFTARQKELKETA